MSMTVGYFNVGILLLAMFPINVQEKPFVVDSHVSDTFCFVNEQHLTLQRQKQTDTQDNRINEAFSSVQF